MNVKICKNCRRLFTYVTGPQLCATCRQELDKKFEEVKEYIRNNPNTHIHDVAINCDVSERQIKEWLREERLVLSNVSAADLVCEICGDPIASGRFCDKCRNSSINMLNGVIEKKFTGVENVKKETSNKARMRFIHK